MSEDAAPPLAPTSAGGPYDRPQVYDVAFGYRDFRAECDLLCAWFRRVSGREGPRSVLELAAGPADHALELAARGVRAAALDLSAPMCVYARRKAGARGLALDVHRADMINFSLGAAAGAPFDLALLMIVSATHIPTLDDFVAHLRAVAAHLEPGGVYALEMTHPGDFLGRPPRGETHWRIARDGLEVETWWGRADDPYDPIAQVRAVTVEIEVRRPGQPGAERLRERVAMREWTATELDAAVRLSGVFEVAERHGDWALDAPLDGSEASWRMIVLLRRKAAS